ncbi:major capsid protein [Terribacillus sp. JSM ZJ617]|uniref:major capsid protein n=1 Tax=Terribacillus sp. JSM ZJ617 TaxID=3342119 RepID=UPI0035A85B4B
MPLHQDEFQRPALVSYVENVPPTKAYLLRNVLPNRNVIDMDFAFNIYQGKYGKAAKITALNAGAPLADKRGLERAFGQLAKIQNSFRLDEKEMFRFNNPRNDAETAEIIEYVYNETDDLVNSVYDTEEWMRAQAIYQGGFDYSKDGVEIDFPYDIPAANKMTAAVAFSDPTSTPLKELQAAVKQFRKTNNNQRPTVMHISEAMEADLLSNQQIKLQVRGTSDNRLITTADLQNVFAALSLPPYQVQDDMVDIDDGNGMQPLLPERRIVLIGANLGFTGIGPTAEKNWEPGIYAIPEIKETNPPSQQVFVGETAFPALQRPSGVVWLDA